MKSVTNVYCRRFKAPPIKMGFTYKMYDLSTSLLIYMYIIEGGIEKVEQNEKIKKD